MTWDHIYPSYAADQEDYSTTYIKKTEATEIEWAIQNFKKEDDGVNNVNFTTINVIQTAEPITTRHESSSSSNSDSLPPKKQKYTSLFLFLLPSSILRLTKPQTLTPLPEFQQRAPILHDPCLQLQR
jgi:hypothetical protein